MHVMIDISEDDYLFVKRQVAGGITNPLKICIANGIPFPNWTPAITPPKASGRYLVVHGGTNLMDIDNYTTEKEAKELFDEAYKTFTGWDSKNVIKWMPLPEP